MLSQAGRLKRSKLTRVDTEKLHCSCNDRASFVINISKQDSPLSEEKDYLKRRTMGKQGRRA